MPEEQHSPRMPEEFADPSHEGAVWWAVAAKPGNCGPYGRMGGPGSLSLWLTLAILINGFGVVLAIMFFRFVLFLICYSVHFPCNLQHFGEGSCQFNNIATFWSSNLSFSMVFASIGAQTSHVQGYFATRIHLRYWLGLLEGCIQDVLNVGLV